MAALARAVPTFDGWTVTPRDEHTLELAHPDGRRRTLRLDPRIDGRWWSWSFVPPGPNHPSPTLAVGHVLGISIFRLDSGARVRLFTGHGGPVYGLAPSPDGRWLASGSSDQTIRLWRLAGSDTISPLGATFGPAPGADGLLEVRTIAPRGFAEAMDLRKGDLVEIFVLGRPMPLAELAARADGSPPGLMIEFKVRRGPGRAEVFLNTSKHDAPALTLFPGEDREWALWMTDGYYDTSKAGDHLHLGWHRNPPARDRLTEPTDAFPADKFEAELRRPKVIDTLLDTADVSAALATLAEPERKPVAEMVAFPVAEILEPVRPMVGPLVMAISALPIHALARAVGGGGIDRLSFLVDGRKVAPDVKYAPARDRVDERARLEVPPGFHRVSVLAASDRGKERVEGFDVLYRAPAAHPPRLFAVAIGVEFADRPDALIEFAEEDAEEIKTFLARPGGRERFSNLDVRAVKGTEATAPGVLEPLETLAAKLKAGELGLGDTIVISIESHLIQRAEGLSLLVSGARARTHASIPTAGLTELLGGLTEAGCRVMLLLDVVHSRTSAASSEGNAGDLSAWVRELYLRRGVIVMVASNQGPSERHRDLGAFTRGIVTSFDASAQIRRPIDPDGPVTLDDFQDTVVRQVEMFTGRRQHPFCYRPETVSATVPILDPKVSRAPGGEFVKDSHVGLGGTSSRS